MIDGFASAASPADAATSGSELTDNGNVDAEGEATTSLVGGRALGNISPPAQTSGADAAAADIMNAILSNSFMNEAWLEEKRRRSGVRVNQSFRR